MNAPRELPVRLLQRELPQPLAAQLAAVFAERCARRTLLPGARLPSVRECARLQGVSTSTVVAAYDQLQAQGLIEARRQRGFFVREGSAPRRSTTVTGAVIGVEKPSPRPLAPPVDATALIRGMFQGPPGRQGPGLGTLPEPWLDAALLDRAQRRVLSQATDALRYGDPAGDMGLRQALSRRLGGELGIAAQPDDIVTTLGATQDRKSVV